MLSEVSDAWESTIEALDTQLAGGTAGPDAADRRYLYETLVGAWPVTGVDGPVPEDFVRRAQQGLMKSVREAKRHSSWTAPNESYEQALDELARRVVTDPDALTSIRSMVRSIDAAAATNSLATALLKLTVPGVPDIYQGDDSWFLRLVDPDNRVPLDAAAHRALLAALPEHLKSGEMAGSVADLLATWRDGRVKQLVVRQALRARREHPTLFATGRYVPLEVTGTAADHVVAFARIEGERWAVAVAPRLVQTLVGPDRFPLGAGCWGDTRIAMPEGARSFTDRMTGRRLAGDGGLDVAEVLATLPVALLDG